MRVSRRARLVGALAGVGATSALPATNTLLTNGDFEDGLSSWSRTCEACALDVAADTYGGRGKSRAAVISAENSAWSSGGIVQTLPIDALPPHCAPGSSLLLEAYVRNGPDGVVSPAASVELVLGLPTDVEDAPPPCRLERDWPSSEWERLALRCVSPATHDTRGGGLSDRAAQNPLGAFRFASAGGRSVAQVWRL